jgi:hypothetical protein
MFGAAPDLYRADRGFFSAANVEACQAAGVTCACIPQAGGKRHRSTRRRVEPSLQQPT